MADPSHVTQIVEDIRGLVGGARFNADLAQVRARAISAELGSKNAAIAFTFDPTDVWRRCDFVFSEATRLLREGVETREELLNAILQAAQAFEFLSGSSEEEGDQEKLLLCAAVCYHIAGYQANAQCLARLVESRCLSNEPRLKGVSDGAFMDVFRRSLVAFLKRDIGQLQSLLEGASDLVGRTQLGLASMVASDALDSVGIPELLAHGYFHESLRGFAHYCETGDDVSLQRAHVSLEKSYRYFERIRDVTPAVLVSELRTALDLFVARSTWRSIRTYAASLLEDPVWVRYLGRLALDRSIVEFWTSQLVALERGLLSNSDSFVIQMPTSAGKTLIAELAILASLTSDQGTHCLYIAPYRALVNEVQSTLSQDLGAVGFRVSTLLGGFDFDDFQGFLLGESDVLIATPEKAELLLRTHPDYFGRVGVVVVDEGHIIDEGIPESTNVGESLSARLSSEGSIGRGALLELLVTRLRMRLPEARFLYLSAVMPKADAYDFVNWLAEKGTEPLQIDVNLRPARQVTARFEWVSPKNGQLLYTSLPKLETGQHPFVPYFISRKQYLTGEYTPNGKIQHRSWPNTARKAQTTAMLAARFARSGPVLVFCAAKDHVRDVVEAVLTSLQYMEASGELNCADLELVSTPDLESYGAASEWLGKDHLLTRALRRRVGLHFGPLPEPVRNAIENDFREGRIRILVSTNTLGQGVNMPIRTALIHSLEWTWEDEASETGRRTGNVKKRDFENICGRAGRAGKETEGLIVFVTVSKHDGQLFRQYSNGSRTSLNSALYQLLVILIQQRLSSADLVGYLDSSILAILAEEVVDTNDEQKICEFLGSSLVGVQALRKGTDLAPLAKAFSHVSSWIMGEVPDRTMQKAFASTGLRVKSCQTLLAAVDELLADLPDHWSEAAVQSRECDVELLRLAFGACRNLAEMQPTEAADHTIVGDEFELVHAWIRGASIDTLIAEHWANSHVEEFGRYIGDRVTYKLPWGLNAFMSLLAARRGAAYQALPMSWRHLASMMKCGVNDVVACWARDLGISRHLAMQVARDYAPEKLSFTSFLAWLGNLPVEYVLGLDDSDTLKARFFEIIMDLVPNGDLLRSVRERPHVLKSPVQGIRYENRDTAASLVQEGDVLMLAPEPRNPYDRYAIRVLSGDAHIGYVGRDVARILSQELVRGRKVMATASLVRLPNDQYPWPWIEMDLSIT